MTPAEILEVDAKRNHPPGTKAGNLMAIINEELRGNSKLVQQGNTLILFGNAGGVGNAEFHCFNADTPENLAKNVLKFFEMLQKLGYKTSSTPYENAKISDLFKAFIAPKHEVKIDKKDGRYVAKVRL
jgi:hypothetical protein